MSRAATQPACGTFVVHRVQQEHGPAGNLEPEVAGLLSAQGIVSTYRTWSEFATAAQYAECAIVLIPRLNDRAVASCIPALRRRAPDTPVVVVTSRDPDNALAAVELGIAALVWSSDVQHRLPTTVARARQRSFLRSVATNAQLAPNLPNAVRDAITIACRQGMLVRSLGELAAVSGTGRSAFVAAWRQAVPNGPRPKQFLDWILLLSVCSRKTVETNWATIAHAVGADEDTLRRVSVRLTGHPLSRWSIASTDLLREEFRRRVLLPLGIRGVPANGWT